MRRQAEDGLLCKKPVFSDEQEDKVVHDTDI
jgi:hypothetical protein